MEKSKYLKMNLEAQQLSLQQMPKQKVIKNMSLLYINEKWVTKNMTKETIILRKNKKT